MRSIFMRYFVYFIRRKMSLNRTSGKPVDERLTVFSKVLDWNLIDDYTLGKGSIVLISMPPFNPFKFLLFCRRSKVILDIRDGWSIAQQTGYGGNAAKMPIKAFLTRVIERYMIKFSYATLTCTPGLQEYLESISGRKVLLITNGISDERMDIIQQLRKDKPASVEDSLTLQFICAGKFSEYGPDKVAKLLAIVSKRYSHNSLVIKLVGSDPVANAWVVDYFRYLTSGRGKVEILPRVTETELCEFLINADFGLTIVRDPSYEFGTKIFDYIAAGLPIINYFDRPNKFTDYFDACLDVGFGRNADIPEIRRSVLVREGLKHMLPRLACE